MITLQTILLALLTMSSALLGGVFFVFSSFAMTALSKIKPEAGIAAMQSINLIILKSSFMPIFFVTALGSLAIGALAIINWQPSVSGWALAGAALYLIGCLVVTAGFNVPLNDLLASTKASAPGSLKIWTEYLQKWLPWNHLRTLACILAAGAYLIALIQPK